MPTNNFVIQVDTDEELTKEQREKLAGWLKRAVIERADRRTLGSDKAKAKAKETGKDVVSIDTATVNVVLA